ncbi:phosphotransferase [Candidatus Gracilibacteria bacterium]|nr:phosphotransferase [Candidatus Gracilibacteria bacterium]
MHTGNCLFARDGVGVIDFEDCGFGYYLYDLAVALDEVIARYPHDIAAYREQLLCGYRQERALARAEEDLLDLFVAIRLAELIRWYASQGTTNSYRHRAAAGGAGARCAAAGCAALWIAYCQQGGALKVREQGSERPYTRDRRLIEHDRVVQLRAKHIDLRRPTQHVNHNSCPQRRVCRPPFVGVGAQHDAIAGRNALHSAHRHGVYLLSVSIAISADVPRSVVQSTVIVWPSARSGSGIARTRCFSPTYAAL